VVSDGRLVQNIDPQMPCFGVRKDGSIAVGYLPPNLNEDAADSSSSTEKDTGRHVPYQQLVCGVVWLVRNGTSFVKESLEIEGSIYCCLFYLYLCIILIYDESFGVLRSHAHRC
jgi:N-acetylglucosamine-1-phosphodiester alpha-N-acetylglucosaminidase